LHRVHQMNLATMTFDELVTRYLARHDEEEEKIRASNLAS
jgi:hypothetical protein